MGSLRRVIAVLAIGTLAGVLSGCGGTKTTTASSGSGSGSGGGTTTTDNPDATGNWLLTFTSTSGTALFPTLSGYIFDNVGGTGSVKSSYAEMTALNPGSCYVSETGTTTGTPVVLAGNVTGATMEQTSLSSVGQFLSTTSTLDSTSSTMTGSYTVRGGCAGGAGGTFIGQRYDTLSGSFTGTTPTGDTITLQSDFGQNGQGSPNGLFILSGDAAITGVSCFSAIPLVQASSYVTGKVVSITMAPSDPTLGQLVLSGTLVDPTSTAITVTSANIVGGSCAGNLMTGGTSFTLSK